MAGFIGCIVGQGGHVPELEFVLGELWSLVQKGHVSVTWKKTQSKGGSGILEVRKVNCVNQIHTTPWNLWMKSITI